VTRRAGVWLGAVLALAGAACSGSRSPGSPSAPPPACAYALSTTAISVASTGASASIGVVTAAGCAWTATSNAAFATITAGASQSGTGSVSVSVAANTGEARTAILTVAGQAVTITQAASDPLLGNWSGSIAKGAGCPAALPATAAWTGTIRRNVIGQLELVISAPTVGVFNQTLPLILNGDQIQFAVQIDVVYTFVATLSADRRSFTGTFSGGGCSGTWNGAR
jgi:hypothetical protein